MVKDLLIRYPVQPVRDTSHLTSHTQYIEDFLNRETQACYPLPKFIRN